MNNIKTSCTNICKFTISVQKLLSMTRFRAEEVINILGKDFSDDKFDDSEFADSDSVIKGS